MSSYVPDELLNMVEKCYLFKVFSKVGVGCDGEKCYPISKINDDEELSGRFKCHNSEVIKLDMDKVDNLSVCYGSLIMCHVGCCFSLVSIS